MVDIDKIFKNVLKENASIPSKYVVADLYVLDGNKTVKKGCTSFIDAWSQGIDSGKDFNIRVLKKGQYLVACEQHQPYAEVYGNSRHIRLFIQLQSLH